jgi:chemotaxis protein MotB
LAEDAHPEIVIVKRHARHADEHHGGAWKIAFADFMTAMMALFLVLWLISSTSEKQKQAVAQYFNPVKLVDMTTVQKGFHEPKETEMGSGRMTDPTASDITASAPRPAEPGPNRAKEVKPAEPARARPPRGRDSKSRDAQAPDRPEGGETATQAARPAEHGAGEPSFGFADPFATVPDQAWAAAETPPPESRLRSPSSGARRTPVEVAPPEQSPKPGPSTSSSETDAPEARSLPTAPAPGAPDLEALASEILEGAASETDAEVAPRLEVRVTDEGVLISLTDTVNDTMFAIGSSEPHRKTIEVMQRIARSLAARPGAIVIRGHTDARPYRSGTSDNWRLSTARAHAARDVLVRSGLADGRIERVEGYADRSLKVGADPTAPENRRIEILLRKANG